MIDSAKQIILFEKKYWWDELEKAEVGKGKPATVISEMSAALGYKGQNAWIEVLKLARQISEVIVRVHVRVLEITPKELELFEGDPTLTKSVEETFGLWLLTGDHVGLAIVASSNILCLTGGADDEFLEWRDQLTGNLQDIINIAQHTIETTPKSILHVVLSAVRIWAKRRAIGIPQVLEAPEAILEDLAKNTVHKIKVMLGRHGLATTSPRCEECGEQARIVIRTPKESAATGIWYICDKCKMAWPVIIDDDPDNLYYKKSLS